MQSTERLYYSRPRLDAVTARLVTIGGEPSSPLLVLDRSIFYPEGGGQPCDLGTVAGVALAEVREEEGRILHRLAAPLEARPGALLELRLDAKRRLDHTEQHSAQHLLSGLFSRIFDAQTLSFHLGAERCTIDFSRPDLGQEDLELAEAEANALIAEDYAFIVHLSPPEDIDSLPLRKRPPAGEEQIRIVEIDGLDYSPCCGTHVSRAGELRLVKILGAEKYKGMTRLSFVAGGRALEDYRRTARAAREASRALSAPLEELGPEASRTALRLKEAQGEIQGLRKAAAGLRAELALARRGGGGEPLLLRFEESPAEDAQEGARALAERGVAGIALSLPELTACAASPAGGPRLGELLKPLALERGGKGGGGPTSFRAAFPSAAALEDFGAAALGALGGRA